ncbi:hypothetical protein F7734_02975 [Scytonema sp. UIC 10036]|uniref:hypothetical protein n=1 Tax=Scytonema sp. UIC 10036 TaxID=2304196 RepID=UPI0012DABD18|nr:hypothetical protein [Scytonema sp. UIC 10036]MUG91505.1 hypothetical protein [Scytonema sp. UIC 10036]
MTTKYLEILKQLKNSVSELINEAENHKRNAAKAKELADKSYKEALTLEKMGEKSKAQKCLNLQQQCIDQQKSAIENFKKKEELAKKRDDLAKNIERKRSEIVNDIDKLEDFLRKGCDKNDCPEIRQLLIQNSLIEEFQRYQELLKFCQE